MQTYVACEHTKVTGYFALAAGAVDVAAAPGRLRGNMPDPILGMVVSPLDPMTLMVTITDLRASLASAPQL